MTDSTEDPQASLDPLRGHPRYSKVKHLNSGGFGFVQLAFDKQQQEQVAIKFLPKGRLINKDVLREIQTFAICGRLHPSIIRFKAVDTTEHHLAIVMEYANSGDLSQHVEARGGKLQENDARKFFQQAMLGVAYCHKKKVFLRDIKLENMLLVKQGANYLLKVCDFGVCKTTWAGDSIAKTPVGTLVYFAPEVMLGEEYNGFLADMWSSGVTLYKMLYGEYPFPPMAFMSPAAAQPAINLQFPRTPFVSPEAQHLISRLLTSKSLQRITMEDVLRHPWFLKGLPASALTLNDRVFASQAGMDKEMGEDIERLVMQAAFVPSALDMYDDLF